MKTIQISDKKFREVSKLCDEYSEIYGNADTIWDLDDLDGMREIGGEFMAVFASNLKK